jgi:Zn finger protein HypA/HybF involved in hydrogenase expression
MVTLEEHLFWCETCDNVVTEDNWNVDEGMCQSCTEVNQDRYMEGQVF